MNRSTQTEPFLQSVTQYIIEHPATVMLLLGLDPMADMTAVLPASVEYYDTRGRRPSMLEQIVETETRSHTPSSTASDRQEYRSPAGSVNAIDKCLDSNRTDREWKPTNLKRNRYSTSDLCEESERLLARPSLPSSRSLKFNVNS